MPVECEPVQDGIEYHGHIVGLGKRSPAQLKVSSIMDFSISRKSSLKRKKEFVTNIIPTPVDDVRDQERIVLLPEIVREKGFYVPLRSEIDSSKKDTQEDRFSVPVGSRE
ncbi:hypothetical protein TNCV_887381 [Trichonephila clavipes]|uniref:Uncharacterized protein n=1 Tax=Trichonephila clavipes TaxID=2585209 RepID=A0A8X6R9L2_TRICX|nr:hypothetical protein TNCV_887381 [Trichonephila clavipes]